MSNASPADIITYIGVPLAVIGVLPILYTCARALLVLRSIRKVLAQNGHSNSAVTRGSMMSGIVEVELPRYTITPLDREEDEEYWKLNLNRSSLLGGSWSYFHWNCLVTGKKLYRIQYKDELLVPQAEIDFDELVGFLLDRGAIPDENGWNMLRTSGLWAPAGTVLLRSPLNGFGAVLRTSVPDDSDGVLSLKVHWQCDWDKRDKHCLPPFWMRIHQPRLFGGGTSPSPGSISREVIGNINDKDGADLPSGASEPANLATVPTLLAHLEEKRASLDSTDALSDSIRFRIESDTIEKIYFEQGHSLTGRTTEMGYSGDAITQWFVYTASSLGHIEKAGTWSFALPQNILLAVNREAVPCGVMELLDIMQGDELPHWASPRPQFNDHMKFHNRFLEDMRAREVEKTMPPAQAEASRRAREQAKWAAMRNDQTEEIRLMREYEEKRGMEALTSPKLNNKDIADACLRWLVSNNHVPKTYQIKDLAKAVLYLMVLDSNQAKLIAQVCDRWTIWHQSPGMNRSEIEFLRGNTANFCYASSIIYTIQIAARSEAQVSTDMQECLKVWKKVRLG
ncbi:hypothetical protein MGYG_03504 [Nannizzia gypsea CBS 118893]|uniref:Uncharacterized protein n=1 Tax=Arthroderma gypseum (strain ATCC MYA-4604 / CBS 118893) TaxID=535722 RepID=E4USD5_ARTGP|nr:hypothetical protein MGYG_03504 [Nannizzia gypsea CBS 118893]EFR00502.1 hypothetical protein MGYG_03504 [Nannizzia gypsea CBS 118893]